jgi:hypothetical protein
MTSLGSNGRFGNQLLQYGFLRAYAAEFDLEVQVPDWIGRDLFDLDDPYPILSLPQLRDDQIDFSQSLCRQSSTIYSNVDIWGYFIYPTRLLARYRELFQSLYQPGLYLSDVSKNVSRNLRNRGETIVTLHLRRGDFGYGRFWIAPTQWYIAWLHTFWETLDRPVLYVATDDPSVIEQLSFFNPLTAADISGAVPGIEFYTDFHVLRESDIVAISNSTFSFTATLLNTDGKTFVRPNQATQGLVAYEPWDSDVVL